MGTTPFSNYETIVVLNFLYLIITLYARNLLLVQSNTFNHNDWIKLIEVPTPFLTQVNYRYNTLGIPVILPQVYVRPHNLSKGVCSSQDIVLVSGY